MNELELLRLENARLRKMVATYKELLRNIALLKQLERIKNDVETGWREPGKYRGLSTRIKNTKMRMADARRLLKDLNIAAL